jgi:hypothetical protein
MVHAKYSRSCCSVCRRCTFAILTFVLCISCNSLLLLLLHLPPQLRLRPQFHFPITLGFNEVSDILIPEKNDKGVETDFFKNSFASTGSRKVYERFVAKLRQYKAQAAAGSTGGTAAAADAAAGGRGGKAVTATAGGTAEAAAAEGGRG